MAKEVVIEVKEGARARFHNNVDYCVGTGRMGLALTREYQEQLKLVQQEIGFRHIRGHGLFCDDMAIYQEYEEDGVRKAEYNFTYLDRVMDGYLEAGLRPFLELGFMPEKLARGTQTIFYWKGNTTPPRDYKEWQDWCRPPSAISWSGMGKQRWYSGLWRCGTSPTCRAFGNMRTWRSISDCFNIPLKR